MKPFMKPVSSLATRAAAARSWRLWLWLSVAVLYGVLLGVLGTIAYGVAGFLLVALGAALVVLLLALAAEGVLHDGR